MQTEAIANIISKTRRETIRFMILRTLHICMPQGMYIEQILPIIQASYSDATQQELRQNIHYLSERKLVSYEESELDKRWVVKIIRYGIDLVEGTVECEPGIARPNI